MAIFDMSVQLERSVKLVSSRRSASLKLGNLVLGYFGEVTAYPQTFDVKGSRCFETLGRIPLSSEQRQTLN